MNNPRTDPYTGPYAARDGRQIDPSLGTLGGEGAQQQVRRPEPHPERRQQVWGRRPSESYGADPTYYERPLLKEPVWIWSVPAYFYVGGVAGASALLGALARLAGSHHLGGLMRRCRTLAAVNIILSALLLIYDLGRPLRFYNMLRVLRITSPMSIGSWILSAAGAAMTAAALPALQRGTLHPLGSLATYASALFGVPLAAYTAVLISNTAVPLWQVTRRTLPFLFIGSAISSAGALLGFFSLNRREARTVVLFTRIGTVLGLVSGALLERELAAIPPLKEPLETGLGGDLWKAGKLLDGAALLLSLLPGDARAKRVLVGVLATAGALCVRFGIFHAGKASSRNPRAAFRQQRAERPTIDD